MGNLWHGAAGRDLEKSLFWKCRKNIRAIQRRTGKEHRSCQTMSDSAILLRKRRGHRLSIAASAWLAVAALALLSGCRNQPTPILPENAAPHVSTIEVKKEADGIHVKTATAEFILFSNGYLKGTLAGGNNATLDEPATEAGQTVVAGHKQISDISLDLTAAKIGDVEGKLGKLGKQIEVTGTSASTGLAETLRLEVYDDFPGLALLSASFQNGSDKDVALEEVTLQQHRFDATVAGSAANAHDLWSFHGSSIRWGKDEVLQIPAKFNQENVFGAPVKVGGDLGSAGGGIPVVACWTKNRREASGRLETLLLVISITCKTA